MRVQSRIRSAGVLLAACTLLAIALFRTTTPASSAAPPELSTLENQYAKTVRPIIAGYCQQCHGSERTEADIDLERLATWADVRKNAKTWQKVAEMLESEQMPPKKAKQPTAAERMQLKKWVRDYLTVEARASAGDPGPVVLRRLSNAEYTYTLRDLTGVESLSPAREFPVDGAAGEGFTNTGNALVMSPALLTKYLDAAKDVANHAVLLPDGFRFSPSTTRRDWTNETLTQIREFYRQFTDAQGGQKMNLQGVVFDTNEGGRLAVERYLAATLAERESLRTKAKTIDDVAKARGLNAKYLATLWDALNGASPSFLLDRLRARWRTAKPEDAAMLAGEIGTWQKVLWKFGTVGHIGKVGGPKAWMEPISPITAKQEVRFKIPETSDDEVTISLVAINSGDGNDSGVVNWQQPKLVAAGRPDILLRDVRDVSRDLAARRESILANTEAYLSAAQEAAGQTKADPAALAAKHGLEEDALRAWLDYLGIGAGGPTRIDSHFKNKILSTAGYDFIKGWGANNTPFIMANSSAQHVRIPGNMKPHSVAVHPSPILQTAIGWQSPVTAAMRIEGKVVHAHPECGNGVTWSLELRRGAIRRRLASGVAHGGTHGVVGPVNNVAIQQDDLVSLLIGPRNGNHACDLTEVDFKLTTIGGDSRVWHLAQDVANDILAGNPHADRFGNANVWHFYTEPDKGSGDASAVIPAGSLLEKWQSAKEMGEKQRLAKSLQKLLTGPRPAGKDQPDAKLHRQTTSLGGPLFGGMIKSGSPDAKEKPGFLKKPGFSGPTEWGLDPASFGKHPDGKSIDAASLCVRAPAVIEVRLPADLVANYELVTTGVLEKDAEGSVQLRVVKGKPSDLGLVAGDITVTVANGLWTGNNRQTSASMPILVNEGTASRKRIEAAFDDFRRLFPAALCYTKIVPVDEVVTLTLYYREDHHLMRLMLDDKEQAKLNRLWDELHYISHDALTLVDALEQLIQYATQDADPKVFEPLRKPFQARAENFRQRLIDTEPRHLDALVDFAGRAYRRPLSDGEKQELRQLYRRLREKEMPHEEAFRLTLARVFVSPTFLYRLEQPGPADKAQPVSDWELATRLSYFLWSSPPDEELRQTASAGRLRDTNVLLAQTRRMLNDARVRRLATEFACQWLHIYDFHELDEKSESHFPTFAKLREPMYEESIQFFTDLFRNKGSVRDILDADHTFLNEDLAKHYGIPGVSGPEWRRVNGVKKHSRGGILGQATTLAKQSGASRTSPILRGNWVSEILLGERLPRPPRDVPRLPEDETATEGLTVRQLVEKHSSDPKCAICHQRIDAFGFSLEGFDAIGRRRTKDLANRPIETRAKTMDGVEFEDLDGLRNYLLANRRDAFMRQFCRKLLGYALGRGIQLSDEPLLAEMQAQLKVNDYRVAIAVEMIVKSPQFREIRGRLAADHN